MEQVKTKLIIVEGTDRSGKGELIKEINKRTAYKHITQDRGPIGWRAYAIIFNRDESFLNDYFKLEKEMAEIENTLIIYLHCETKELINRCIETDHELLDFDFHKNVYDHCLHNSYFENKLIVNSTNKNPKQIVDELLEKGLI